VSRAMSTEANFGFYHVLHNYFREKLSFNVEIRKVLFVIIILMLLLSQSVSCLTFVLSREVISSRDGLCGTSFRGKATSFESNAARSY